MRSSAFAVAVAGLLIGTSACGSAATSSDEFPDRPFTVDVSRVDPCAALTDQQLTTLGLQAGRHGTGQGGTSRACTWIGGGKLGWNFQTLAEDASVAIGAESTSSIVTISGFGAVQSSPPAQGTGLPFCQAVVDVADGAAVRAQVEVTPTDPDVPPPSVDSTCDQLRQVTGWMLANVHAQQSS